MLQKSLMLLVALGILALASGCSLTNNSRRFVAISVLPADARIIANGVEYPGAFPQFIEVRDPSRQLLLTVFRPGYREKLYTIDSQLSSTGKIDAWASPLIFPLFGLFTDGAWEPKEHNVTLVLDPLPEEGDEAKTEAKPAAAAAKTGDAKK